jgi:hypothetical protein
MAGRGTPTVLIADNDLFEDADPMFSSSLRRAIAAGFGLLLACQGPARGADPPLASQAYDVVVYGGTSGGIIAAVQAARMGKSAVLIEPGKHLGGLTSGGLGATDIGNKAAIGGLSRDFYRRIARHYARDDAWVRQTRDEFRKLSHRDQAKEDTMWTFEPHVAEAVYREMLREAKVPVLLEQRLDRKTGVRKEGNRIASIATEGGQAVRGSMFIDATYEGDLMAAAGVSYHVGREANATYGETLNGVFFGDKHQFRVPIDPYVVAGDPASGLLLGIQPGDPGRPGQGDRRVQAYNFRMCMTDDPANRIPWPRPEGYDPARYEIMLRYIQAGVWDAIGSITPMPNHKTDTNNNGAVSTDNIGMNYDYPEADYGRREAIFREHATYQQGLMWFLANDPRVPEKVRRDVGRWGLSKDEFTETGGWPHQLYVREARRMISDYVMTQHNCQRRQVADDAVGLAAYNMDSHNCQRYVDKDGHPRNEGDVQVGVSPYPIAFRSIVPKEAECANLLVPVCLAASHIAYGSIRMEPVFMVLGQSAATAACQAIERSTAVQRIDVSALQERLKADGQVLAWTGPARVVRATLDPKSLPGTVLDDGDAKLTGDWTSSAAVAGFVGSNYIHDGNTGKGEKSARFELDLPAPGRYEVRVAYVPNSNRATNVPITIESADGVKTIRVNQQREPSRGSPFVSVGTFRFEGGKQGAVVIGNQGTDGHVIVDAVQCLPAPASGR